VLRKSLALQVTYEIAAKSKSWWDNQALVTQNVIKLHFVAFGVTSYLFRAASKQCKLSVSVTRQSSTLAAVFSVPCLISNAPQKDN